MNARLPLSDACGSPPGPRPAAAANLFVRGGCASLLALLCASAQAQETMVRLVQRDAAGLLQHPDPVVRGEAALVAAPAAAPAWQAALLALADDPDAAARHRALVALGLCGSPGAVQRLEAVLLDTGNRGGPDGQAAAFALGLVPPAQAGSTTARVLAAFAQGSWRRQRDCVLALLWGLGRHPERPEVAALRRLFDDDSNRDPEVRALLLRLLLPHDRTFEPGRLRRLLERGSDPERLAVLRGLAGTPAAAEPESLALLERLAAGGEPPAVRTAALAALTRARHLPALELAAKALRSEDPDESGQGLRSMLAIGGTRTLRALAQRVIDERDPLRLAALLANFDAPLPRELADHCARLAADTLASWPVRTAAATALARSAPQRAAPLLRDLFRAAPAGEPLPALAQALQRCHAEPVPLDRLLDRRELAHDPARWQALLRIEHPEAQRLVLARLQQRPAAAATVAAALQAWRRAMVLAAPDARDGAVPPFLVELLGR